MDLHVLVFKEKGTERSPRNLTRKNKGQKLSSSGCTFLVSCMPTMYTNSGCRDLPGMALARLGLGAMGGWKPEVVRTQVIASPPWG